MKQCEQRHEFFEHEIFCPEQNPEILASLSIISSRFFCLKIRPKIRPKLWLLLLSGFVICFLYIRIFIYSNSQN